MMPPNYLILCRPLLLLPLIFPSIGVSSSEYSGLISFKIGWFDLLAIQGTLKSLLQHYNSKASILQCSAFFMVQLIFILMSTISLRRLSVEELMPLNCGAGEDSWESLGLKGDQTSQS